jgi:formate/nitrite transporter FocA (FNT family)
VVKALGLAIGHDALAGSFGDHFGRAIVAGWIVALLVWVLPGAGSSRAFLIVAFTYLIGAAHLSHVVAGSCEIAYVAWTGGIPWGYALRDVVVPTLLGNVVGGTALVAALARAQVTAGAPDTHARHLGRNR